MEGLDFQTNFVSHPNNIYSSKCSSIINSNTNDFNSYSYRKDNDFYDNYNNNEYRKFETKKDLLDDRCKIIDIKINEVLSENNIDELRTQDQELFANINKLEDELNYLRNNYNTVLFEKIATQDLDKSIIDGKINSENIKQKYDALTKNYEILKEQKESLKNNFEQNNNVTSVLNTGVGTGINEKISNNQSFGDNTQIRVNETLGDLTVAAGSNTELNLSQIGIGQSSYLSNFAFGSGTTHTETSNVQEFGDNTEINLNVTTGNQILDGGGDSTIESNLIGIDQRTSYNAYSALDSSGTNQNISNQTFGKGTKILLSSTMGDQNTSINSRTNQSSHLTGVIQESVHSIYGSDASSVENRNDHSQIFGNDTQILLSTTFGNSTNDAPISEYIL